MFQNNVEQVVDVVGRSLPVGTHPVVLGRAVYHGEVKLVLRSLEGKHQVEYHLIHLLGAAVGLVHLVDYHHRLEAYLQCLLQHEACLWHRTLKSIHEEYAAIGHIEHALHLTAKVRVTRRVDDIYLSPFIVD